MQPTLVFLPIESPWTEDPGVAESDMTEKIPIANSQVNEKPQLFLHQPNNFNVLEQLPVLFACFMFCLNYRLLYDYTHTHTYTHAIENWLCLLIKRFLKIFHFIMKYFKYKESWKHLYSQHVYTQHLEFNTNILLYLIYHIFIHTYIFLYKCIYFKDF